MAVKERVKGKISRMTSWYYHAHSQITKIDLPKKNRIFLLLLQQLKYMNSKLELAYVTAKRSSNKTGIILVVSQKVLFKIGFLTKGKSVQKNG